LLDLLQVLVSNPAHKAWLAKQKVEVREIGSVVKLTVESDSHWEGVKLTTRVLSPVVELLRLTDGKTGATLGKVYHHMSNIAAIFNKPIDGMEEDDREKMHDLFLARWTYFHEPIFTAAYFLDPEFIRGNGSDEEEGEFRLVLRTMCLAPGCTFTPAQMVAQWAALQTAIAVQSHGMNDQEAFHEGATEMPAFEWARTFLIYWPAIKYAACRLPALACSASGCEHSWSISGWIQSKKRNRLGQPLVESLVRTHTNLLLEASLDTWKAFVLPWMHEMVIDDPVDPSQPE
jgi:hypothetical protein